MINVPQDAELLLQDSATITATTKSAGLDLGAGREFEAPGWPCQVVIDVTALDSTTGNETYALKLQESVDDVDGNYADCSASLTITATGVVSLNAPITKRWVRVVATLGGTTPSLTFAAWLNPIKS